MICGAAWLFCPAHRSERIAKAAALADVVILDLEDGVPEEHGDLARKHLRTHPLDPRRTVVRIHGVDSPQHELDLRAVAETPYLTVMLAKTESAAAAIALAPLRVVALCETPLGVLNTPQIASAGNVDALLWGAEDLIAALGGTSSRSAGGTYRHVAMHARTTVLLAAAAAGKVAIDAVYLNFKDASGLAAETADGAASGFAAKACIHPDQLTIVRKAYVPSGELLAWAKEVLSAATGGAFQLDGEMIDRPLVEQARMIMARATAVLPVDSMAGSPAR